MMSKVSSRCVPLMLTLVQKAYRQQVSEENLDMLRAKAENFFSRIITGDEFDETWVHHHDQRPNKRPCNGNTMCPLLPRNFVCNNQPERSWKQFFFWTQKKFCFWNHATQDNHYWRHLCFHNGDLPRENRTETPWKVIGWCPAAS